MKKYKWEQEQVSAGASGGETPKRMQEQVDPGVSEALVVRGGNLSTCIFLAHLAPTCSSRLQISHMKEYIARFGHGSAKLARQAQSKEKTLDKMVRSGLTEKVAGEKVVRLRFENVGKLPPPVLQFTQVWRGGRGEQRCRHPSQHSRSHCSSSPPVIRRPIFSRPPLPCSSHASTPPAPPRLPAGCIWVQPQQGAVHKCGLGGGPGLESRHRGAKRSRQGEWGHGGVTCDWNQRGALFAWVQPVCTFGPVSTGSSLPTSHTYTLQSTLLKLMTGQLEPLDGMVKRHNHLRIGQYHQHLTESLNGEQTPLEYMVSVEGRRGGEGRG